jgi:hypothetical protein
MAKRASLLLVLLSAIFIVIAGIWGPAAARSIQMA